MPWFISSDTHATQKTFVAAAAHAIRRRAFAAHLRDYFALFFAR